MAMKWSIPVPWRRGGNKASGAPAAEQDLAAAALAATGPQLDDAAVNETRVRTQFWPKLRRVARRIPFMENLVAAYYCAIDPATPATVRATLFGGLAYFVLPMDFIPDIVAGLGYTDDAAVISAMVAALSRHVKPRHRDAARAALGKEARPDDANS